MLLPVDEIRLNFNPASLVLLNVVLGRQIATQREQIAALKALGYDNRMIGAHYIKLVLVIVTVGVVVGLGMGALMGHWFTGIYADVFRFPELRYRVRPVLAFAAVGVSMAAALLATWNAIRTTVQMAPAEAMRPPSPGIYKPSFVEAWGLKRWFSPATRMVLRTMQRRPLRTGLTVFGIAVSMAIVITGLFWRDAIEVLMNTQFNRVLRGDVSISLIEATPARVAHDLARLPHVSAVEGTRSVPVRLVHGHRTWRGALQGRAAEPDLFRIVDMDLRTYAAPRDGLLVTDRLAELSFDLPMAPASGFTLGVKYAWVKTIALRSPNCLRTESAHSASSSVTPKPSETTTKSRLPSLNST